MRRICHDRVRGLDNVCPAYAQQCLYGLKRRPIKPPEVAKR